MRFSRPLLVAFAALGLSASPAGAAIFSFEFAFPIGGLAEIPGSTELASNGFVTTEVTVGSPTRLSLYRLRQANSSNLLPGLAPPGADVDLVLGANRFEVDDRAFDLTGDLVATFTYSGGMKNKLGLVFNDGGGDVATYYAFLPFRFYVDATASYAGIGPYTGTSNVIYFTLPGNTGLYRLQAAVPEPGTWAMMIAGFGMAGATLRLRRTARSATV